MTADIFQRFAAERDRQRKAILMDDTTALATQEQFDALSEYSASFPSGTYVGKVWKRRHGDGWLLGEYVDTPDPNRVGVKWRELMVVDDTREVTR